MRNQGRLHEIIAMRRQGKTLQQIGDEFDLTRERVRQICDQAGVPKPVRKKKEKPPRKNANWQAKISALDIGESFLYDGVITDSLICNVKTSAKRIGRKVQVYKFHSARIRVTRFD